MPNEFRPDETEEILRRAIAIDTMQERGKELMRRTAEEMGISQEALDQAEREYFQQMRDEQELREFTRQRRASFWSHLGTYFVINASLVAIDLISDGRLEWAYWPILGWGIGIAIQAIETFNRHDEDFQKAFEKWRKKRNKAESATD